MANLTDFPDRIAISDAFLVNEGWVRGAGESQVLFVVEVRGRSCGYLTVALTPDTLWVRELYLDGRTWRGAPKGDSYPVLHRGLGKLILAYFDEEALRRGRSLGIFTTRSLGLLKACDHLFGQRCQYHVTDGDPPFTLFRQRGLGWLPSIEAYSASLPPHRILVFRKTEGGLLDDRNPLEVCRLVVDDQRTMRVVDSSPRTYGPEDGLLVSIGPSVDIVVSRKDASSKTP
jgi:hypothetical protein